MRSLAKPGHLDTAAWRTATRWAPLVVQGVVGLLFLVMWLLGTWPFATHGPGQGERAWLLSATVVTVLLSLAVSAALARSESWR
ncbi:hypothetical protein [Mycobacterium asiaticum]|uniref:hypothetical protein n=1 Tax=Mycobacterium asiaticum TaxID=1790 RepID=UPI000ABB562E|nr:hypothetical protein [Mycobacterium asiaticum]